MKHIPYGPYEKYLKRPLDLICCLAAVIAFCWLYAIVALMVRIKIGKPILFKQDRPGKDGKLFKMYKFRTMTDERDETGKLLPDMQRLTEFGKFLRNSSLDELPELFNIIKGDMSIIGPRPLLVKYLPLYNDRQKRRHEVRPGLSGYAQVHGRNNTSWEDRFEMDVRYVDRITFIADVKILFDTVITVIRHEGVDSSETKTITMEEFKGSE